MLYIYTLTWNGSEKLKKLNDSLMPALNGIDYTWVIKDNGSKDDTIEVVKSWNNPFIKLIEYPDNNHNFAQGMNYCHLLSTPKDDDFVLLLNNDVIVEDKKSIKNMIDAFKDDIGVVGAKLLYPTDNKIQHCGVVFNKFKQPYHLKSGEKVSKIEDSNKQFQAVTGAVWLTKAGYYKQIAYNPIAPGLDERHVWGFEDIDACLFINFKLKKKVIYCGKTLFSHEESATLKKKPQHKLFLKQNMKLLHEKWGTLIFNDDQSYLKNSTHNNCK